MRYSRIVLIRAALFILMVGHVPALAQTPDSRACASLIARDYTGSVATTYFPRNIFSESTIEWFSKYFPKMQEPPLHPLIDCRIESYRFLWLRTFHAPLAVRLWRSGAQRFLVVKKLRYREDYEPGKLVVNKIRPLSEEEWREFIRLLGNISYWELPTEEAAPPPVIDSEGRELITVHSDGAQWIIEGVRDARYHVASRWSAKGAYREVCLYLLRLSGLKIKVDEIY